MKSFREILSEKAPEKKYRSPQQLNVNIGGVPSSSNAPSTGGIVKRKVGATKPRPSSGSTAAEVSARAQRFSQAFGTPTGADPRTGAPTYRPPTELTNLPSSRTGATPSPEAYSKVKPGDLEIKRQARTAEVPGKPGVRSATPQGVQNFLLNRETGGMSRRSIPAEQGRAAQQRVDQLIQNPNVVADVSAKINQEVGGRRAETSTPAEPFSVSKKDQQILQRMARPETSIPSAQSLSRQLGTGATRRGQAASDAAKDIQSFEKQRAFHGRVMQAIKDLPPETSVKPTPAPEVVKPLPRLNLDKYRVQTFDPKSFKPVPAKASQITRTTAAAAAPTAMTAKDITKIVKDVAQSERQANAAEKAAASSKTLKSIGRIGTLGALISTGIDAKGEYDKAKREGASRNRALASSIAGTAGRVVGTTLGAISGGAIAGPVGAFMGGSAGYTGGGKAASSLFKAITGDNKQKLTTQRVLSNIRKTVPQEIRREIPAGARKAFRDLVTQTGRTYGNWRRSQESAK